MQYQVLNGLDPEYIESLRSRFWAKVDRRGECWEWTAGKNNKGYGKIGVKMQYQLAHRVSYELNVGPIPAGLQALHKCDNPKCVNPNHLFLGTNQDNILDRDSKGRQSRLFGKDNNQTKLTVVQVKEIRQKYRPYIYSTYKLATEYNVTRQTIMSVLSGETWKNI